MEEIETSSEDSEEAEIDLDVDSDDSPHYLRRRERRRRLLDHDSLAVEAENLPEELSISSLEGYNTGPQDIAATWLDAFKTGCVSQTSTLFQEQLRLLVPKVFTPVKSTDCLNIIYDENAIQTYLLEPFQRFLFNNADPKDFEKVGLVKFTLPC